MRRIIFLLRVVALTLVLLAMSVVPASGTNTAGTNTAKYCNYGYHPPAAEAGHHPGSP
jgi:ABC-type oligopeptide transport system substrate-binding subunit